MPSTAKVVGLPRASGLGYELVMRSIRVLHLTQLNDNSPTRERLQQAGLDRGVKVEVLEVKPTPSYEFNFDLIDLNGIDSILCTAYFDIDQEREGNFLQKAVELGVNVVVTLFPNSSRHSPPTGRFKTPLRPGEYDNGEKNWRQLMVDHCLFDGAPTITPGSCSTRSLTYFNQEGSAHLVAEYLDGKPLAAIRYDQAGIVTSLGFPCGRTGSQDGLRVVINALLLSRTV